MINLISAKEPYIIDGGIGIDDRGSVGFVNDFNFQGIKRFYMVSNHSSNFVRAWHAHKNEGKAVLVVKGSALVGAVFITSWEQPSKSEKIYRYVLSADKPALLCIPPGYANGFMSLTQDAKLIFFSTSLLEDSKNDDVRYDSRYWDIWQVVER